MKRYYRLAVLLLSLGLLGSCGHGGGSSSVSYTGNYLSWTGSADASHFFTLVRVDGRTGAVTNIGGFDYFPAMAYAPDGTLYGISDELHIINPADGSTVKIGTFQYGGDILLMVGASFSPAGTLYVIENWPPNRVFTVNLINAALTYVGADYSIIKFQV